MSQEEGGKLNFLSLWDESSLLVVEGARPVKIGHGTEGKASSIGNQPSGKDESSWDASRVNF